MNITTADIIRVDDISLDDALKAWRLRCSLTQVAAAALLRVPLPTYQGWEQGRPTHYAYCIIVAALALTEGVGNGDAS
jgi:DNA-binding transcriptional regulator YiaG